MTYIPTWCSFLYLAVVLDAFSRQANLVVSALDMALHKRPPAW